jgi:hypothetical protein
MSADAAVWMFITITVVLFWGTPDIHDAIINYLMK